MTTRAVLALELAGLPMFGKVSLALRNYHFSYLICLTARMLLNFKGIDYKTEWVDGPDIGPTCESL